MTLPEYLKLMHGLKAVIRAQLDAVIEGGDLTEQNVAALRLIADHVLRPLARLAEEASELTDAVDAHLESRRLQGNNPERR